jgi:inorganic pyrophosphatase/exopolyphosphatase
MWWSSSSGRIELQMTKDQAEMMSHQGQCDADVEYGMTIPKIKRQLNKIDPELLKKELKEYGAWEDDELQDHQVNLSRILWLAAGDIKEEQYNKKR